MGDISLHVSVCMSYFSAVPSIDFPLYPPIAYIALKVAPVTASLMSLIAPTPRFILAVNILDTWVHLEGEKEEGRERDIHYHY